MIFLLADNEPLLFVMFNEQDVITMRQGRTLFIDDRHLQGRSFQRIVCCLNKTDDASMELLKKAGKIDEAKNFVTTNPKGDEVRCKTCNSLVQIGDTFEDRCIVCWATQAKKLQTGSN